MDKSFLFLFFKKGMLALNFAPNNQPEPFVINRFCACVLLLTAVAGCDRHPRSPAPAARQATFAAAAPAPAPEVAGTPWFTPGPQQAAGAHLAYSHTVGLEVDGSVIAAHFTAARDRCLNDAALHCILLNAEFGTQPTYGAIRPMRSGSLRVRLPHDQIAAFANALTTPLQGEAPGLARVVRQSTTAEDLGRPIADVGQRMAQVQDYLASLKALGSRLTISVSDLVKIASETAQAQTQIEAAQAEQRELSQRVATELLEVDFQELAPAPAAVDPVAQVWADAAATFRRNLADVVEFGIAAAPWVPVGLVAAVLLVLMRWMLFGRARK